MSIWDESHEKKLMEKRIANLPRTRAYSEGFRDGVLTAGVLVITLSWLISLFFIFNIS